MIVRLPGSLPQDAAARGFGAAGLVRKIFHIWCRNAVNLHKSPRVNTVRTAKCEVNVKKVTLVGDRVRGATPSRLVSTLRTFGRGTRVLKPPFVGPLRGPVIVAMAGVLLLGGSMTYGAVTYSAPVAPVGSPLVVESPALPYRPQTTTSPAANVPSTAPTSGPDTPDTTVPPAPLPTAGGPIRQPGPGQVAPPRIPGQQRNVQLEYTPFETVYRLDPTRPVGTQRVLIDGHEGVSRITVVGGRVVSRVVLRAPVSRVILTGSAPARSGSPSSNPSTSPTTSLPRPTATPSTSQPRPTATPSTSEARPTATPTPSEASPTAMPSSEPSPSATPTTTQSASPTATPTKKSSRPIKPIAPRRTPLEPAVSVSCGVLASGEGGGIFALNLSEADAVLLIVDGVVERVTGPLVDPRYEVKSDRDIALDCRVETPA